MEGAPNGEPTGTGLGAASTPPQPPPQPDTSFTPPPIRVDPYTDDRKRWEWVSRYPAPARRGINFEAWLLSGMLALLLVLTGLGLGFAGQTFQIPLGSLAPGQPAAQDATATSVSPVSLSIDPRLLTVFFAGCVGGTTFSIKWLVHAAAKGRWHLDRRYWRLLVPLMGGVYACVVLTLSDAGFIAGQAVENTRPIAVTAAFAFLVGYFADGVSGLLSNIANAVFGTLEKK